MTTLREAAQQALEAMDREIDTRRCKASTLRAMIALRAALAQPNPAQRVVDEQAEDEGLWFNAMHASEGYLQQELRKLHAAIENKARALLEEK